jgi:hypothetical protein
MTSALICLSWGVLNTQCGGFLSHRGYPQIIHFSTLSHYKPSGYWGTPFLETTISGMYLTQLTQLFCDSSPAKDAGSRMASPENRMGPRPYGTAD